MIILRESRQMRNVATSSTIWSTFRILSTNYLVDGCRTLILLWHEPVPPSARALFSSYPTWLLALALLNRKQLQIFPLTSCAQLMLRKFFSSPISESSSCISRETTATFCTLYLCKLWSCMYEALEGFVKHFLLCLVMSLAVPTISGP